MNSQVVLACQGLHKIYGMGDVAVPVLKGIDLAVHSGESIAIVGASGSGKSTLLHLLGGLDRPTQGRVELQGRDFSSLDAAGQGRLRNATARKQRLPPRCNLRKFVSWFLLGRRFSGNPTSHPAGHPVRAKF